MAANVLLLDDPLPGVRRLTLNRPEKRNALNNELRGAILDALSRIAGAKASAEGTPSTWDPAGCREARRAARFQ